MNVEAIGAAVLAVFGVYGILNIAHKLCCRLLRKTCCRDRITIYVDGTPESIESTVRSLLVKNPNAEIIIADNGQSRELCYILDRLCGDCARVHIAKDEE